MKFIKINNGDRYNIVDCDGNTVAYINKYFFGSHGHWRGWEHWIFDSDRNDFICGWSFDFLGIENIPAFFGNIKEAKAYYETISDKTEVAA